MATARFKGVGISAMKLRRVMDVVRNMEPEEAEIVLKNMTSPAANAILATLRSAMANAENNENLDREELKITQLTADQGPKTRRFRPKARGRAGAFNRPSSHIIVELEVL